MEYAVLVSGQALFTIGIFIDKAFSYEYSVVVPLAEDEGSQDYIHYIEPDVAQSHYPQDPEPADSQREECQQGELQATETQAKEDEYNKAAYPPYLVEAVGEDFHKLVAYVPCIENQGTFGAQGLFEVF